MEDDVIHDLTPAYALDALDAEEQRRYEEHLEGCDQCREELASFGDVSAALAYAVEPTAPPPGLRQRIVEQAARERIAEQAAREEHAPREPQNVVRLRRPWYGPALGATASVAAAAAIVLGIWAGSLQRSLDEARTSTARQDAVIAILANPESQRASLKGAQGALVVDPAGEAALAISSLGPAPSGKTYQAWVMEDGDPEPAGIFAGGAENSVLRLTRRVPPGATVAVTLERDGGAQAPTSRPLLSASRA